MNTITHGIGFLLSVPAAVILVSTAAAFGDPWRLVGCAIYAVSLVGVYAASTLSHFFSEPRCREFFRTVDQAFIYLLIVGTYTPLSMAYLRTTGWWLFLVALWGVALIGFVSKMLFAHRVHAVALWSYLVLGWMPIVAAPALVGDVPSAVLWWMLAGGICYTVGTVFLLLDRRVPHFHAVWHLCVIAGSGWHFFAIFYFVANGWA